MATNKLSTCKTEQWTTKLRMRLCSVNLLAVIILASLPYISTLSLPSGDPAPGRSPGPPETELYTEVDTVVNEFTSDVTTETIDVTSLASEIGDACAFARIPSESEVVTLSESESEVNLTLGHVVFETDQLVRGVVYDVCIGRGLEIFDTDIDDIFSSIIGPVFEKRTPHPITNNTQTLKSLAVRARRRSLSTRTRSQETTQTTKIFAPLPYTKKLTQQPEKHHEKTKERYNMLPQTKQQFETFLQQPIPSLADFDKDFIKLTTQQFERLRQHEKRKEMEDFAAPNISRRALPLVPEIVVFLTEIILNKISKNNRELWKKLREAGAIHYIMQRYMMDREALIRSTSLMEQFIYDARSKFLYAQKLKDRYAKNTKYRIGYTFAVLENLRQQYYACYHAMSNLKINNFYKHDLENVMPYLKVYERAIIIKEVFRDVVEFLTELEDQRSQYTLENDELRHMKEKGLQEWVG